MLFLNNFFVCEQLQSLSLSEGLTAACASRCATPCKRSVVACRCKVHFGRAEIVTVTLLCNKPACRKPPDTGGTPELSQELLCVS